MFKRPQVRSQRNARTPPPFVRPTKGVVYDIISLPQYCEKPPRLQIAQERSEEYLEKLEKNYAYHGVPFKRPNVVELQPRHKVTPEPEKHIEYLDQIQVNLVVPKNGKVRIKLVLHGAQMYEKYYARAKAPPIKTIISAYKNLGYSDAFIASFTQKHKNRLAFGKKIGAILEGIFDKSVKKVAPPQKKKVPEEDPEDLEEDEDDEEDPDEDDAPLEDEGITVDDDEEPEEEPEEFVDDLDE